MEQGIQRFEFEGRALRCLVEDGAEWFNAADACAHLDLDNVTMAMERLDEDEKSKKIQPSIQLNGVAPVAPQWFVTEPGLYALVLASRKPEAKAFKRWVTHEVLPAIRGTGTYSAAPAPAALDLRDPAALQRLALELTGLVQEQAHALTVAKAQIAEDAPKVEAWRHLMDSSGLIPITEAGKAMGVQPLLFHRWMVSAGHVYKRHGDELARQDHLNFGRMKQVTVVVGPDQRKRTYAKLTPHGLAYFTERIEHFRAAATHQHRKHALPADLDALPLPTPENGAQP